MSSWQQQAWRAKVGRFHERLAALLEADDPTLREGLEALAQEEPWVLSGLAWKWAAQAYQRDRVRFRPLVLAHGGFDLGLAPDGRWVPPIKLWDRATVEGWLEVLEREGDIELFRRVYRLSLGWHGSNAARFWRSDVLARFEAADAPAARRSVLSAREIWYTLDEDVALALYRRDPEVARPFVRSHLPFVRQTWLGSRDERWTRLMEAAWSVGDEDFYFELYRAHTPAAEWRADIVKLARELDDPTRLDHELQRRQSRHAVEHMLLAARDVLEIRGEDALPWVLRNLSAVRRYWKDPKGYKALRDLALSQGWLPLWAALVRQAGGPGALDKEVSTLLDGKEDPEPRLRLLAGAGNELNGAGFGLVRVLPLSDDVAVRLYARLPHLLSGPFWVHVSGGYGVGYPKLLEAAIQAGDDDLVDRLASRVVLQVWQDKRLTPVIERLVEVYGALPVEVFPGRAAAVLGALPAFAIWSYDALVERNALARLLFERSGPRWLDDPVAIRDLLESPQIHVQVLAFRLLSRSDPRARRLAAENLDLLLPTLLRPLHRRSRLAAFAALRSAASHDGRAAQQVLERARDALDLPDRRYPKEALIGLIGEVLHGWPALRRASEAPVIWRAS